MSAPIAVNTADGVCWTRRGALRGGEALYAPEGVCDCPPFVMATLAEVAEHGIVGSADALPMPVGPAPQVAETFVPRTERSYWVDIAAALNAAESVGMSIGIDLDGTLTDRNAWSVIWDRDAKRWTVAGYDEDETEGVTTHDCGIPLTRRLACGHCPHEVCQDCDRCPCSCKCAEVTPQVQKLRMLLAGQREQAAAETGGAQ